MVSLVNASLAFFGGALRGRAVCAVMTAAPQHDPPRPPGQHGTEMAAISFDGQSPPSLAW
jgi:hypothetical protein